MSTTEKSIKDELAELDATPLYAALSLPPGADPSTHVNCHRCSLKDNATGKEYVWADGDSDENATAAAIAKAKVTPKPMTKAQRSSAETQDELQRLRDQVREMEARLTGVKGKKKKQGEEEEHELDKGVTIG